MRKTLVDVLGLGTAVAILTLAVGCGSSTSSTTSTISERTSNKLTDADVAVFASHNATVNLITHPDKITRAQHLLKPLTVTDALKVNSSNKVAGGLVENLLDELDNTVPGLTTRGSSGEEHLNVSVVNRFLRYAKKQPRLVFEPEAAKAVAQIAVLLHSKPRELELGTNLGTAESYLKQNEKDLATLWPSLARQLSTVRSSLR